MARLNFISVLIALMIVAISNAEIVENFNVDNSTEIANSKSTDEVTGDLQDFPARLKNKKDEIAEGNIKRQKQEEDDGDDAEEGTETENMQPANYIPGGVVGVLSMAHSQLNGLGDIYGPQVSQAISQLTGALAQSTSMQTAGGTRSGQAGTGAGAQQFAQSPSSAAATQSPLNPEVAFLESLVNFGGQLFNRISMNEKVPLDYPDFEMEKEKPTRKPVKAQASAPIRQNRPEPISSPLTEPQPAPSPAIERHPQPQLEPQEQNFLQEIGNAIILDKPLPGSVTPPKRSGPGSIQNELLNKYKVKPTTETSLAQIFFGNPQRQSYPVNPTYNSGVLKATTSPPAIDNILGSLPLASSISGFGSHLDSFQEALPFSPTQEKKPQQTDDKVKSTLFKVTNIVDLLRKDGSAMPLPETDIVNPNTFHNQLVQRQTTEAFPPETSFRSPLSSRDKTIFDYDIPKEIPNRDPDLKFEEFFKQALQKHKALESDRLEMNNELLREAPLPLKQSIPVDDDRPVFWMNMLYPNGVLIKEKLRTTTETVIVDLKD